MLESRGGVGWGSCFRDKLRSNFLCSFRNLQLRIKLLKCHQLANVPK